MVFFFFFSSRRRHTRLQGDWSSDVCSSDAARVAPRAGRDGALVPFIERVLGGEAAVFERAFRELAEQRVVVAREARLDARGKIGRRVGGRIPVPPLVGVK